MNHRLHIALLAVLCGLSGMLAACSTRSDVSLTGNTPAQYSHVWMTVQEVWLNSSATAGPEDGGWAKFPLSTPSTVDLVAQNGGNLGSIASGLRIPAATYSQVRLIPVDATAALAASAQNAGAIYNFEADFVDSEGVTQQVPLELMNPDKGIGIQTDIKVRVGNSSPSLTGSSATTTGALPFGSTSGTATSPFGSTTGTTNDPFGSTNGTMTNNTTSTLNSTSSGTTSNAASNSFAVTLDGGSDLVAFSFATGRSGILLSAHAAAYDLSQAGGISGHLSLTNVTTSNSGLPNIRVSAQTLSADGTRHIVVSATALQSDGSFLLYPLATNSSTTSPLTYDVVIHGPGIATIIVKSVQVPRSSSTSGSTTSSTSSTTGTTGTTSGTGTTSSSTTTVSTNSNVNAVSIGTVTPRADPNSYTANVATAQGAPLPAGAMVNFYQTLTKDEVPYVIESSPIDPFNQVLFNPQTLSSATVDSGTWSTNGTVTIVSASPVEGTGIYKVAAVAPGYSDGTLDPKVTVSPPTSGTATVVVSPLKLGAGATAGSLAANVIATAPGKYDQGELLLSHDGTLVAAASLDSVLTQGTGGVVTVANLPSATPNSLYYATVRAWKSTDPGSVQRQWYPQAIDLRTSTSGSITLPVN
jgi:hypothetical protein